VSGVVLVLDGVVDDCELMSVLLVLGVVLTVPVALVSGAVLDGVVAWLLALLSGVVLDGVVADCELISVLLVLGVVDWLLALFAGSVEALEAVEDCELISVLLVLGDVVPDDVAGTECSCPASVGVSERVVGSVFCVATLGAPVVSTFCPVAG